MISDGARIVDPCIDYYSQIGWNVVIENSAIMDRAIVGDNAHVRHVRLRLLSDAL